MRQKYYGKSKLPNILLRFFKKYVNFLNKPLFLHLYPQQPHQVNRLQCIDLQTL